MRRWGFLLAALAVLAWAAPAAAGLKWIHVNGGYPPPGAVVGGQANGRDLYICRARHQDGTHIGKVYDGRCNFGWGGREQVARSYDVLVQTTGGANWVRPSGGMPRGMVGGSYRGGMLYVCRSHFRDGYQVGKVWDGRCNFGWGGREESKSDYEVLSAPRSRWINASGGSVPSGAISAGTINGREVYVCKAHYQDGEHPGKFWDGRCLIGWGGKEVGLDHYQILVGRGGGGPVNLQWERNQPGWADRCLHAARAGQSGNQCICRAHYRDGTHVGKTVGGKCNIGWGGQEVILESFEVLTGAGSWGGGGGNNWNGGRSNPGNRGNGSINVDSLLN